MKEWFLRFSVREQLALLLMGVAVALYCVFMLLVQPLAQSREELVARNLATAESLKRVDMMATEIRALRAGASPARRSAGPNLTASLNSSAERFALRISRLQPSSSGAVQLRFERAALEQLLRWIYELESAEALQVDDLSLSQTSDAGVVSATLRVSALN
jgi:type II secretory pathway component PulM